MQEIEARLAEQKVADREAFEHQRQELFEERHAKKAELFALEQEASLAEWVSKG